MNALKKPFLFTLCLLPVALVGGWFSALYLLKSFDPSLLQQAIDKVGSKELLLVVSAAQAALHALICGFFGYLIAEKLGLMRPFRFRKAETVRVALISIVCGALFSLDAWTFAKWIPQLSGSYAAAGSFDAPTWIASVLYGGVIEEVMLRLFLMSLFALVGWKLFRRAESAPSDGVLIAANVLAALLFAAGHLPSTALLFGSLTPLIVLRCFLLNGAAGLAFGRFYRKYGIQYAMLAHILFHLVSRTIWLIALP